MGGKIRGPKVALVKNIRKYLFSQTPVNEWDKTRSTDCVNASGVNRFKNKIGRYLIRLNYTSIKNGCSL